MNIKNGVSLKAQWLNLMLHFSGVLNKHKLKVIETTGPKVILYAFWVLLLEITNILISLPAYAFISSKEFAGNDRSAIRTYQLRRVVSLSVLAGMMLSVFVWILVSFFGLVLFPGKSYASVASWDFNTPLAYNYDTTKIQITDGTAIFKAQVSTLVPVVAPTPVPVVEPIPAPVVEPTPSAPAPNPGPLLFDNVRQLFKTQVAYAQTNSSANTCSATLQTITPLVVTPFVKWTGFSETANKNGGEIYYVLSGDGGLSWLYWNGSGWVDASTFKGNTAIEINDHISEFPITLAANGAGLPADLSAKTLVSAEALAEAGTLMFKSTFESDCNQDVSLLSLTADYQDQPSIIASFTSPETSSVPATTVLTSEADPTVIAVLDSIGAEVNTSLTTDTAVDTGIAIPITFSVHVVTKTTGTPGRTLYSIPGVFSLSEGADNGLVLNVTGTDLQTTTLSSSANVAVGDHLVVLVYDGSTLKLYVDGAVSASLTAPIVVAPPANVSTSIGCVSAGFVLEALTLAEINANYLQCSNQAPTLKITEAMQKADDGFVDITYTATDADNDFVSIPVYEYSATGAFAGEESQMTVATFDTDHDGVNGLVARNSGAEHTFVWNAKADLPNYSGNVYVRLRANDGLITGPAETFYPVRIDTKAPVVSSFVGSQTRDSGTATLSYTLSDASIPIAVALALSADNGLTWVVPAASASGAVGNVNTGALTISWNANQDLPGFEGTITARLTSVDVYGNAGITTTEIDIDTRAPIGLTLLAEVESNTNQILWHWSPSDDRNFDRYIITYGTNSENVRSGSIHNSTNVSLWGPGRDSDLLLAGTDRTVVTSLVADTFYYAKITAYDDYGHEQTSQVASFRTQAETTVVSENVGEILPDTSTLPPTISAGGFKIVIDSGAYGTNDKNVALMLTGGDNTALMLISNTSDFADASLEDYASSTNWNLCASLDSCDSGRYTVYAKYYTSFGVGGTAVSDNITLTIPASETPSEIDVNSGAGSNGGGSGTSVSIGGSSGGGGNGPVISLTTNERQIRDENISTNNQAQNIGDGPTDRSGIASSFVPTAQSVLQSIPEFKGLAESRESGVLAKPQVALVDKSLTGQTINFTGTGIPKAKIALFIHSDQVLVYTTDADLKGQWSFSHDQRDVELAPGEHTVFAVTYDPGSKVKSKPSIVSTFYVKKSPAAVLLSYTNLPTTLLTLVVLLFGTLYIYSRRKQNT